MGEEPSVSLSLVNKSTHTLLTTLNAVYRWLIFFLAQSLRSFGRHDGTFARVL